MAACLWWTAKNARVVASEMAVDAKEEEVKGLIMMMMLHVVGFELQAHASPIRNDEVAGAGCVMRLWKASTTSSCMAR